MTRQTADAWATIGMVLDLGWPAPFPEEAEEAYRAVLGRFPVEHVARAVQDLAASGAKFRPSVGEIAAECHRIAGTDSNPAVFHAPSWAEIYEPCEDAAHRHRSSKAKALALVDERCGPVAAAWFAAYGRTAFLSPSAAYGCSTYGEANRRELGKSYERFVASQRDCVAKGLTVATTTERGGLRLVPADPSSQLAALPPAR